MKRILIFAITLLISACQSTDDPLLDEFYDKKEAVRKVMLEDNQYGNLRNTKNLEMQITSLQPQDAASIRKIAKNLYKSGHKVESLGLLETGSALNPKNEELKLELGKSYIQNDRPKEAISKLLTIKKLKNKEYYNALGIAHDMSDAHETAQNYFKEGLKVAPNDGLLQNNLALSYILNKEPQKGIVLLRQLVRRPDALPKYRHNLAMAYGIIAKPDEARKLLEKDLSKKEIEGNLQAYEQMRRKKDEE